MPCALLRGCCRVSATAGPGHRMLCRLLAALYGPPGRGGDMIPLSHCPGPATGGTNGSPSICWLYRRAQLKNTAARPAEGSVEGILGACVRNARRTVPEPCFSIFCTCRRGSAQRGAVSVQATQPELANFGRDLWPAPDIGGSPGSGAEPGAGVIGARWRHSSPGPEP